jgi:hypothetical protein
MTKLLSISVLTLALATAGVASAQQYSAGGYSSGGQGGSGVTGFGYGGFGYGYHSSTFEEGVLRGAADLTRATGEANYFNSLAAINLQEANAKALANRQARIAGFFNERELNRAARKAEQPKPLSPQGYAVIARKAAPDPLGPHQYDRFTGKLHWPTALSTGDFVSERAALEMAFATRGTGDAGAGTDFHAYVQQITNQMHAKLQPQIGTLSPMEFVAARKFLASLAYEALHPANLEGLATK